MNKKKIKDTIQGGIIGISLTLAGMCLLDSAGYHINLVHPIKNVINSEEDNDCKTDIIYIENTEQLNQYIKNKPTFSEIREVINKNENLSEEDKTQLLYVIDRIEYKIPFIDTRALYENCTSLKVTRNKDEGNKNSSGSFFASQKRINLKEESSHVFHHESLHMTNCLCFYDKEGNDINRHFYVDNDDYRFLSEGLNEWLTQYLFNYPKPRYKIETSDIWIYQFICQFTDKDLVKVFIEENYSSIFSCLNLSELEKEELVTICKKIYDHKFDEDVENITGSEFLKKYQLLLKACLNLRKNEQSLSCFYEIQKLLYTSYSNYKDEFPNEVAVLNNIIHDEILEKSKNNIVITKDEESINYLDWNNLYLIYNDIGSGDFKYIIGEKYFYHGKKQYHVDKSNFIESFVNKNLLIDPAYNPRIIPIRDLIEKHGYDSNHYTFEEICNMYQNSLDKKKRKVK